MFPEFASAPDALVTVRLGWATLRTPLEIWNTLQEQGIAFLTAHYLAILPNAKDMRKGEKPGDSMYLRERENLELIVSSGFRVAKSGI